jgi:peptide/nickel transport system substrate-binding protein
VFSPEEFKNSEVFLLYPYEAGEEVLMRKRFATGLSIGGSFLFIILMILFAWGSVARAQETPRYGGTFIVGSGNDPATLNLATTISLHDSLAAASVFNLLVKLDHDLNPHPDLAHSWRISEDGLTYIFNLVKNATWHDGKPFTSADVKFTFTEVLSKHHPRGGMVLKAVESVEAPDPYTVSIRLKHPYDPLMKFIGNEAFILPKHLYENTEILKNPYNIKPVGTGPFVFKEWKKGSHLVFERNPNYFKKGKPYVDKIIVKIVPDTSAKIIAFEAKEIDYLWYVNLPSSEVARFKNRPGFVVSPKGHEAHPAIMLMAFNLRKPLFNNLKVRQAIAHAIDKQYIEEKADYGLGKVAVGPIASSTKWAFDSSVPRYEFNPKKAEQLLDEAGFPRKQDGIRFKTSLVTERGSFLFVKASEIIKEQLGKVGIDVELKIMDKSSMIEMTFLKGEYDLHVDGLGTGPDPAISVARTYVSTNIKPIAYANYSAYNNKEVDELFALAEKAPNVKKRAEYYHKLQQIIVKDLPYLWISEYGLNSAWRDEFKGLHSWCARCISYGDDVWWTKGKEAPPK